jgi:hypothetical protein
VIVDVATPDATASEAGSRDGELLLLALAAVRAQGLAPARIAIGTLQVLARVMEEAGESAASPIAVMLRLADAPQTKVTRRLDEIVALTREGGRHIEWMLAFPAVVQQFAPSDPIYPLFDRIGRFAAVVRRGAAEVPVVFDPTIDVPGTATAAPQWEIVLADGATVARGGAAAAPIVGTATRLARFGGRATIG